MSAVVDFAAAKQNCRTCKQLSQCLPQPINDAEIKQFNSAVTSRRVVQRGEHLFRQGDSLNGLYLVRSGAVKVYALSHDGAEQVLGFYLSGDILGLEAVESGSHGCTAVALETSSICELSFARIEALPPALTGLHKWLGKAYGKEIARDYALLRLLGQKSAEQRLAGFLLHLAERFGRRGFSSREFNLSMSRYDIANYLGLALETVSRLFARLQDNRVLAVNRRHISIRDPALLQQLAGVNTADVPCYMQRC